MEESKSEWNMSNVEGITGAGEKGPDGSVKSLRPEVAEEGFAYPSADGKGYEPIVIPRVSRYGNDGVDRLLVRDIPSLIRDRVLESVEYGNLRPALAHYEKFIDENAELFAPHVSRDLKTLFAEGKQPHTGEEREEWVKKVKTYLNGICPAKNADYKK
jgi:hypothetical protein